LHIAAVGFVNDRPSSAWLEARGHKERKNRATGQLFVDPATLFFATSLKLQTASMSY
jgi:hypothetical protein